MPLKKIAKNMQNAQIAIEDSASTSTAASTSAASAARWSPTCRAATSGRLDPHPAVRQDHPPGERAQARATRTPPRPPSTKTYSRKLQELKYALNVEENFTKDQILEGYLNLVYYGDQAYGVEAAALNYFSVSASKLSLGQAALLAGLVQHPTASDPVLNPKESQARRDIVLDRMQALGMASAKDVTAAKKVAVKKMIKKQPVKGVCHRSPQPYFCAYVLEYLQKSPQMAVLGKTPPTGSRRSTRAG